MSAPTTQAATSVALSAVAVQQIHESFAKQGALTHLGCHISHVALGQVHIECPFSELVNQQNGYFHGGMIGAVADSAAGYAAQTVMPHDGQAFQAGPLSVEYKINFMAPALGEKIIAKGSVSKAGRTLIVTQCEVVVVRNGQEKLCALMQQTVFCAPVQSN